MSDNNTVEYGSDEYYEETGKNGLTINTKNTQLVPAYDKKLFYVDSFFKRMIHTDSTRPPTKTTYSNFYYKDKDGKVYYWHRKRKSKYACMQGGSIVYIDAKASMERFTGSSTTYSVIEPWKRAPVFHGIIDGKAYFTVVGSSKFDDENNLYIARSDDGTLIEPILKIPKTYDGENNPTWGERRTNMFKPNFKGKMGHLVQQYWRKDDDPNPSFNFRHKIFCNIYDGLNYHSNIVAQDLYGDGPIEEMLTDTIAKGQLSVTSNKYPIFVYYYTMERYAVASSATYDPTINTHNFCDMFSSSYTLWIACYWYRVYNANTGQTTDFPFVTHLDKINSLWRTNDYRYEYRVINPQRIPILVLRSLGIIPYFNNLGVCPNGNILVSVIYRCDPRIPQYVAEMYPEYGYFVRFSVTPTYFVIDSGSGEWIKSNIQEPIDYDTSKAEYSEVSITADMRPAKCYTDSEYLWFRKPYREETDITFYGTKDGYNIDKRITYYNRTTIPTAFHLMVKDSSLGTERILNYNTNKNYLTDDHSFSAVPMFENGVFKKLMLSIAANDYDISYMAYGSTWFGLVEDLKPESDGILHVRLTYAPSNGQRYDRYRIHYTKQQPGQSDDDYMYEIE